MHKRLIATGTIAFLAAASQALAADLPPWPNWYVGLSGGVAFLRSSDVRGASTGDVSYNTGGSGAVALGYEPRVTFQPLTNMRLEAELGYHDHMLDTVTLGGAAAPGGGSLQAFSYMANAYYDFRNSSRLTPYIGAGAGGARVMLSRNSGLGNTDSARNVFAYQFMGGIAYAPRWLPDTEWSLGYRYFAVNNPAFNTAAGKIRLDNAVSQTAEIGGRFRF